MSEALKNTSQREKVLVAVLATVLVMFAYFFFRGAVLERQVLIIEDRIQSTQKKVDRAQKRADRLAQMPEYNGKRITKRDINNLTKSIAEEELILAGSGHMFVDLSQVSALAKLQSDITRIAEQHGLLVISKRAHQGDLVQMISATNARGQVATQTKTAIRPAPSAELKRPLYDLYLSGNFHALQSFLNGLGQLEYTVVLTRLRINTTDRTTLSGNRMLDIEVTLAL